MFSVYSGAANHARITSYKGIGLDVIQDGDRITAIEGLVSLAFTEEQLIDLASDTGLRVAKIDPLTTIGLCVFMERVSEPDNVAMRPATEGLSL